MRSPKHTRVVRVIAAPGTFLGKHPWYLVHPDGTVFVDSDGLSHHFTSQQAAAAYREQLITAKGIKNEKA